VSPLTVQIGLLDAFLVDLARAIILAVTAITAGGIVGLVHRWYAAERVPDGLSVLVGLSVVAVYLNTAGALSEVIGGQVELLALETAVFNTVTFFFAAVAAAGGGRVGDRMGVGLFALSGAKRIDSDVSRIVRTVGRVTTVEMPDEIGDIDGYDPVDAGTKEKLVGQTLVFPRRLTVAELRTRFVERLRTDYGVGHVDVDLTDDGAIEYLAIGGRESRLGATLPPGSAAVAIRADPPNDASPGDVVQVWIDGDPASETKPQRVTNAEIRGTADEIVTLAMDGPDAKQLDTERRYRLVTLPVEPRADREFAAQLRTAEETMGVVTIGEESDLVGSSIGALDVAVIAVEGADGELTAIPTRNHVIAATETVYAIGRPDQLRKLETASSAGADAATDASEDTIDDE
jgi:small basic protein